jgi:hypothetical protein
MFFALFLLFTCTESKGIRVVSQFLSNLDSSPSFLVAILLLKKKFVFLLHEDAHSLHTPAAQRHYVQ